MDRSSQKTNKATEILKDTIEKLDLIDIFRTLHPKKSEYTFFSSTRGTFSRIDHILGHKANLNKFRRIEIISSIFSDHNGMKLEINHRRRNEKKPTTWRLNNMLLKNPWVNEEVKKEIKKYLKTNDNEDTTTPKSMGRHKSRAQREIHSQTGLPQKRRKISNQQLNPPPK